MAPNPALHLSFFLPPPSFLPYLRRSIPPSVLNDAEGGLFGLSLPAPPKSLQQKAAQQKVAQQKAAPAEEEDE